MQALPLSPVHGMLSQLPRSKQSTAISTMGWDGWGDTWTNLLLGCCRARREPPESHGHLLNHVAPASDPVASLYPLMRHRSARFRPSSPRSLRCLVEGCTRGLDRAFCRGLPGEAALCLVPLTPRNSFVVLGIHPPTLNFIPFRPSKNYSLQAIYPRNVAGTFCC